jgi:chemotaxis methyl-accepting protein methylase
MIAANARRNRVLRIWSAGCSSGEETFSVAMIAARALEQARADISCSIYGTDVDTACINKARSASYPIESLKTIPERYRKYLVQNGPSAFSFTPEILRMTRFKKLDLFVDNPLKKVEVVLCRNVMIYFDREQQQELFDRFHQALVVGGYLIIGKSEKLACRRDTFEAVHSGCRIYRKLGT